MIRSARKRLAIRSVLALVVTAGLAVPLLGDVGLTGSPKEAAASIADRSRQVTAVSRATNTIDAFWVNTDRRIMTAGFVPDRGWGAPAQIAGGMALSGTSVHAVARASNRLDIFSVAATRNVQTAFWNGSSWSGWFQLGSLRVASWAGSHVHAIGGPDKLDIVAVGEDGIIYHNWWTSASQWSGWIPLAGITAATNTMAYAVYPHGPTGPVHVFAVYTLRDSGVVILPDGSGRLVESRQNIVVKNVIDPQAGLSGWSYQLMVLKPMTSVYPISTRNGTVFIFGTDPSGKTVYNGWGSRSGWGGWAEVLGNGATGGLMTQIFAAVRVRDPLAAELAATVIGTDGRHYAHHLGKSRGTGWEQVPNSQASSDAFVMSAGPDRYNIFTWGSTGGAQTAGWTSSGGWTGWTRIDD
jgi:hypothetical protein